MNMLDVCLLGSGGMMPLPYTLADVADDTVQRQQPD